MAGTKNSGRKPLSIEKGIVQYYQELMPEAFKYAQHMMLKGKKSDKRWAADWLSKGFVKLVPQIQKIGGDENNPIPILTTNVHTNDGNKKNTADVSENTSNTWGNVGKQDSIDNPRLDRPSTEGQGAKTDEHNVGILSPS